MVFITTKLTKVSFFMFRMLQILTVCAKIPNIKRGCLFMYVEDRDVETLEHLLDITNVIYTLYFEGDPKQNISALQIANEVEKELINRLNVNPFKYDDIIDLFKTTVKDIPIVDLLSGTSPLLRKETYSYIRILANLKHKLNINAQNPLLTSILTDQEVRILYMLLQQSINTLPGDTSQIRDYSYKILIDSPTVEKELLNQNFESQGNTIAVHNSKRCEYIIYNIITRLFVRVVDEHEKGNTNIQYSAEFQLLINYLKTALTYVEPQFREELVENALQKQPSVVSAKYILALKQYIEPIYEELLALEKDKIRHFSILPIK